MNTWMKRLGVFAGVLGLTFGLSLVALSVTTQQVGVSGKQVYSFDTATGFARMEVTLGTLLNIEIPAPPVRYISDGTA